MQIDAEDDVLVVHRRVGEFIFGDTQKNQIAEFGCVTHLFICTERERERQVNRSIGLFVVTLGELLNDGTVFQENREKIVRGREIVQIRVIDRIWN
jgi:hypothetical protein